MNTNHQPTDAELREARLTSYALDQLPPAERAAVEAELARSAEARQEVEATRTLAGLLRRAAKEDPVPPSQVGLRDVILARTFDTPADAANTAEAQPAASGETKPAAAPLAASGRKGRLPSWRTLGSIAALLLVGAMVLSLFSPGGRYAREAAHRWDSSNAPQAATPAPAKGQGGLRYQEGAPTAADSPAATKETDDFDMGLLATREPNASPPAGSTPPMPPSEPREDPFSASRTATNDISSPPVGYGLSSREMKAALQPSSGTLASLPAAAEQGPGMYGMPGMGPPGGMPPAGPAAPGSGMAMPGYGGYPGQQPQWEDGRYAGRGSRPAQYGPGGPMPAGQMPAGTPGSMPPGMPAAMPATSQPQPGMSGPTADAYGADAKELREARQRRVVDSLYDVEKSHVPFPDEPPVPYPDAAQWAAMSARHAEMRRKADERRALQERAPAPGTEQYERLREADFVPVGKQPLSTFGVDVDTASYANVRRFLQSGQLPPAGAVRIEEMVNYFAYDYPPPNEGEPFSVGLEVAQCPWAAGHRLVRVGVKAREVEAKQRGLSNLVFLVDVSGSMADENKLALVKQALRMLVDELTEDDRVGIVTYSDTIKVPLESTNATNKDRIREVIDSLSAGGSTNGGEGIQRAYAEAARNFIQGGNNRVILATDGDLNVGITSDEDLVRLIEEKRESGVFLTVLGVGTGNLKDAKMQKLADHGNGVYAYLDSLREARRVLIEQMSGSLVTVAKDVKLQVEFNPAEVAAYRLLGYENRQMAPQDFTNDRKDAGDVGAGHAVTALYELVPTRENQPQGGAELKYQRPAPKPERLTEAAQSGELLTLRLRYKRPGENESQEVDRQYVLRDAGRRFGESPPDFQFAAAVAGFAMLLDGSPHARDLSYAAVEEMAASALGNDPHGYRAEFVDLVRRARSLAGR